MYKMHSKIIYKKIKLCNIAMVARNEIKIAKNDKQKTKLLAKLTNAIRYFSWKRRVVCENS